MANARPDRSAAAAASVMPACTLGWAGSAGADEAIFLNGDRLTGKILSAEGGKLILKTDAAGDVTIDMANVRTFSTDAPVDVRVGDKKVPHDTKVTAGPEGQVEPELVPGAPAEPVATLHGRPPAIRARRLLARPADPQHRRLPARVTQDLE